MSDLWEDEGLGAADAVPAEDDDDWDEGDESLEPGLDEPDELDDEEWNEGEEE